MSNVSSTLSASIPLLALLAGLHAFFLAGLLLLRRFDRTTVYFHGPFFRALAALLLVVGVALIDFFVTTMFWQQAPHAIYLGLALHFCIGPLLWLQYRALNEDELPAWWWFHLAAPVAIVVVYVWPFYGLGAAAKAEYYGGLTGGATDNRSIAFEFVLFSQFTVYLILAMRCLQRATTLSTSLSRVLGLGLAILLAYALVRLASLVPIPIPPWLLAVDYIVILAVFVELAGSYAVLTPHKTAASELSASAPKYAGHAITSDEACSIGSRLNELMQEEQLFLDPELRVGVLAQRLQISSHRLSQYFSEVLDTSYSSYINRHRILEAMARIDDPEQTGVSVLRVGLDVGFNSKAAFNRAFRSVAGMTPTEFRYRDQDHPAHSRFAASPSSQPQPHSEQASRRTG